MPPITNLSAIVLAGGQSSRMGKDKALISVSEVPLLQQVCQVAQACTEAVYVVTPWVERYRSMLDDRCYLVQEVPLPGHTLPHGPLAGFFQGLPHVQTDWVLLLACDLPNLDVDVLRRWSTALYQADSQTIAFLPKHPSGWWEPLCGFYHRRCYASLVPFIQEGGRSFQRWLARQVVQELPPEPQMLFNCNTPDDLKRLAERR